MSFHIIVCIKSVIMNAPVNRIIRTSELCELNPFDRPAIEAALCMKLEKGGTVTALSMGPEASASALYEAMSMGVDRGILLSDPGLADSDTLATSTALAAAIKKLSPVDLVLFGTRTSDSDTGQVGPQTACLLDFPFVSAVQGYTYTDIGLVVDRKIDDFLEKYEIEFPASLTIHPTAIQPRDASLSGIEKAFENKNFETWNISDIDIASGEVGESGSPTKVVSMKRVKKDRKCTFIEGSVDEQTDELVKYMMDSGLVG